MSVIPEGLRKTMEILKTVDVTGKTVANICCENVRNLIQNFCVWHRRDQNLAVWAGNNIIFIITDQSVSIILTSVTESRGQMDTRNE
jgi:hypothetical protein